MVKWATKADLYEDPLHFYRDSHASNVWLTCVHGCVHTCGGLSEMDRLSGRCMNVAWPCACANRTGRFVNELRFFDVEIFGIDWSLPRIVIE